MHTDVDGICYCCCCVIVIVIVIVIVVGGLDGYHQSQRCRTYVGGVSGMVRKYWYCFGEYCMSFALWLLSSSVVKHWFIHLDHAAASYILPY
jgi:hypothetical protein